MNLLLSLQAACTAPMLMMSQNRLAAHDRLETRNDDEINRKAEQFPTYNAYSTDRDVTAPLVYVNYGRLVDYEELERLGISVKGAIVIARYGASWRGIKPTRRRWHAAMPTMQCQHAMPTFLTTRPQRP